ncbi:hypothetical protein FIBSPDRAFT_904449 [Athelia psychrophila]|uniref:AIG1-type G domain-containing protein n=1 Tax=Athelia psychrophila TaxID=1759441 RepID=A0A167URJ5_9AGAM|nr:hypothetical protein FIBSPDRAFT_904449 [Fibularhizoctonia sp. CBS 109695]
MSRPSNQYKIKDLAVYILSLSTFGYPPIPLRNTLEITDSHLRGRIQKTLKLSAKDRIIILMGPTGAGKSTQNGGSVGHSLQSQSVDIKAVRTKHPDDQGSVIFVDTPGFDDTNRSDIEILAQIAGWFVKVRKVSLQKPSGGKASLQCSFQRPSDPSR